MLSSHSLEVLVNFQIPELLAGYLKLKVTHSSKDLGGCRDYLATPDCTQKQETPSWSVQLKVECGQLGLLIPADVREISIEIVTTPGTTLSSTFPYVYLHEFNP